MPPLYSDKEVVATTGHSGTNTTTTRKYTIKPQTWSASRWNDWITSEASRSSRALLEALDRVSAPTSSKSLERITLAATS